MRIVALAAVSLLLATASSAQEAEKLEELRPPTKVIGQQKLTDKKTSKLAGSAIKVTASQLEKHFHLKVTRSLTVNADMVVILEFVKDADDISTLHDLLQDNEGLPIPPGPRPGPGLPSPSTSNVYAYAFDEDNVVVAKSAVKVVSEITGKQGEAFKAVLSGLGKDPSGSPIRKIDIRSQVPIESLIGPNLRGPGFPPVRPGPGLRPGRGVPGLAPTESQFFDPSPDVSPLVPRPPVFDVPVVVPGPLPLPNPPRQPAPPLNKPLGATR